MSTASGTQNPGRNDTRVRPSVGGRPARYTREGLLDLVVGVFNERGYEAASMEDLAKASGFTKSTFYHHVSGKEELLRMAVDRALDALSAALDDTVEQRRPPVDQLEDAIRRTTEVLLGRAALRDPAAAGPRQHRVEREALARRRAIDAGWPRWSQAAVDAEEIRDDIDPRLVSRLLFGMVNSITEWYRPGRRTTVQQAIVDGIVNLAMDGLITRRSRPDSRPVVWTDRNRTPAGRTAPRSSAGDRATSEHVRVSDEVVTAVAVADRASHATWYGNGLRSSVTRAARRNTSESMYSAAISRSVTSEMTRARSNAV